VTLGSTQASRYRATHQGAVPPPWASTASEGSSPQRSGVALDADDWVVRPMLWGARALRRYHAHRVLHLERLGALISRGRRVVLVGNHVLDIVDPLLFVAALLERYGCVPCFIGHENLVFGFPGLREIATRFGMIPSRHMNEASRALRRDGLLMLYPGSGSEAARRSYRDEPYRLKWEKRLGFLRLALRNDADVVFVAAVGIDEMYYQSRLAIPGPLLKLLGAERYRGSHVQFGLLGPHLLPGIFPLPVQITHVVSPPLDLGDRAAARRQPAALRRLHERLWAECQAFLDAAVERRERKAGWLDRAVRGSELALQRSGL
jgi:1-acyl-sn-glycerol-3-phosphate acyltransferase